MQYELTVRTPNGEPFDSVAIMGVYPAMFKDLKGKGITIGSPLDVDGNVLKFPFDGDPELAVRELSCWGTATYKKVRI